MRSELPLATCLAAALLLLISENPMALAQWKIEPGRLAPQAIDVEVDKSAANDAAEDAADDGGQQTDRQPTSVSIPLMLYVPKEYPKEEQEKWPLVLHLHGAGECGNGGDELKRVAVHGIPKLINSGRQFPFVVIAPQARLPKDKNYRTAWKAEQLIALVDRAIAELRVDPTRVYVTGLSMGGHGTWRLAAKYPERIAAAIPICGGGDLAWAPELRQVPIWCFHGEKDSVVPVSASKTMVVAIRKTGGDVKLTLYPEAGHDSWTETYENPEIYKWLLSHHRE